MGIGTLHYVLKTSFIISSPNEEKYCYCSTALAAERHRQNKKGPALVCISKPFLVQNLSPS